MKTFTLFAVAVASALSMAPAVAQGAPADLTVAASPALLRLPANSEDLRFSGETQTRTLPLVVLPNQASASARLYLQLQSAISVAPEWSQLTVAVNGQELGKTQLKAGDPYTLNWTLPPGLLVPGYNAVTLTVDESHRVDCSIDATYELWTRIDPTRSGLVFANSGSRPVDFAALLTAVRSLDGQTPLHGLTGSLTGTETARTLMAMQRFAVAAHVDRPLVSFGPVAGTGLGVDLVVGDSTRVGQAMQGAVSSTNGPVIIGTRADGRLVVGLVASTESQFVTALDALATGLDRATTGSPAGLAALDAVGGFDATSRRAISFGDLGLDTRSFSGRLFRQTAHFRLPGDFYPADYGQADINLDALYAAGLADGASVQFRVNDAVVATLHLNGSRNGEARGRRLPISLAAFRPGLNDLTVEARLPAVVDNTCSPGTLGGKDRRLQLLASSTLNLPPLARIGRFPDLGASGYSLTGRDMTAPLNVVLPGGTLDELNAAGTFLTRMAFASGRVQQVTVGAALSADSSTAQLIAGSFDKLPDAIRIGLPIDLAAPAVAGDEIPSPRPLGMVDVGRVADNALETLRDLKSSVYGLGLTLGMNLPALQGDAVAVAPAAGTDLIVAQMTDAAGTVPVTVLTAATEEQMRAALPALVTTRGWRQLDGGAVALAHTGERLQALEGRNIQYFPGSDSSFTNLRLMVAGWLSNTPAAYAMIMLVLALLLGKLTASLLKRTRSQR